MTLTKNDLVKALAKEIDSFQESGHRIRHIDRLWGSEVED
jgi:hypothetical protein